MASCVVCTRPDTDDDMVQCEECSRWFHYGCAGVTDAVKDEYWACADCKASTEDTSTPAKRGAMATSPRSGRAGAMPTTQTKSEPDDPLHREHTQSDQELKQLVKQLQQKVNAMQLQAERANDGSVRNQPGSREVAGPSAAPRGTLADRSVAVEWPHSLPRSSRQSDHEPAEPEMPSPRQLAARQAMPRELPTFSGDPEEWPLFVSAYETTTRHCGFSEYENLGRLQRCLKGKALEAVRSRLLLPSSVPAVLRTLEMLYGRPEVLIAAMIRKVREVPSPTPHNVGTLVTFGLAVQGLCDHMIAAKQSAHLSNPMLLQELVAKLPTHLKLDWAMFKRRFSRVDLGTFGAYMEDITMAAAEVSPMEDGSSRSKSVHVHVENPVTGERERSRVGSGRDCFGCGRRGHFLRECTTFRRADLKARWQLVRTHDLCPECLTKHGDRTCRTKGICGVLGCTGSHHPLLHGDEGQKGNERTPEQPRNDLMVHQASENAALFKVIPVELRANGKKLNTYAFLDEGSSVTLIERRLADELGVRGTKRPLCLAWTGDIRREDNDSETVHLRIAGSGKARGYPLRDVRTVDSLALPTQSLNAGDLARRYAHLNDVPVISYERVRPGILLGVDQSHLTGVTDLRQGRAGEPIAAKCRLGWVIYGQQQPGGPGLYHHRECGCSEDNSLHKLVERHFSVESVGVSATAAPPSAENQRALQLLESTTRRRGKRFETGLLWRYDHIDFPDSLPMARRRLLCLERRLAKDPGMRESVKCQIAEYIAKGYIHEVTREELAVTDARKVWYLPLGVTLNPRKPGKVRLIWDAAARVEGVSFNDMLLKGPDLTTPLSEVLYGFREKRIALGGDIQEMFHQVVIRKQDAQAQRFLWRDTPTEHPRVFIMDVATFGSTCSPCSAQYVKNRNADENVARLPKAAEAVKCKHYVDDYLDSFDEAEEAVQMAADVKALHADGGFHIRNWLSNSEEVLTRVGAPQNDNKPKRINDWKEDRLQRVLGMEWSPKRDTFIFANEGELKGTSMTKRGILRSVMSQYDPLGLLAHWLVHGRVLIQDIWRSKADWDELISPELQEKWKRWANLLESLPQVRIPRAYFPGRTSHEVTEVQLHVFVDASETAYACVAYLRAMIEGTYHAALVGGKAKVAPLKALSIPRLELQAAVIGARFARTIQKAHKFRFTKKNLWTDSKTLLAWIGSDHRRYRQFVACRIGEILSKTEVDEWRWVPSQQNVADDATKWGKGDQLKPQGRWFEGPEFLRRPESEWPGQPVIEETEVELRQTGRDCEIEGELLVGLHVTVDRDRRVEHEEITHLESEAIEFARFSRYERLWRTCAYVVRFLNRCRRRWSREASTHPTQEELTEAEHVLWRLIQQENPATERDSKDARQGRTHLQRKRNKNPYFQDERGVLRLDTRLSEASFVPYDTRYPIILPRGHPATSLLVDWYHRTYLHANHATVVNEIRQRFHVEGLRNLVRKVVAACMWCRVKKARPVIPLMAPLPAARLSPFTRPFTYVGLDYFGPLYVKVGRSQAKRWVALFTCLTVRAVHLEVVHSLTTTSCMMAVKRFVARRGAPSEIWSDNGTNFVGADRALKDQIKQRDEQLAAVFTNANTKWIFNPPAAPHMGGAWERLVRSVKVALSGLNCPTNPDEETLQTLIKEAEGIVNSRPLTSVPLDTGTQAALTPNHFLLCSSNGVALGPEGLEQTKPTRDNWRQLKLLVDHFWRRWVKEYLPEIACRPKWTTEERELREGDPVVIVEESTRNGWVRGIVLAVTPGRDGRVRQATIRTAKGVVRRPAAKIALLRVMPEK